MADETRYQIYENMLKLKRAFTVQEIAETFNIHPNVARHHLTKLAEINVISADFIKTGKGGRPGRVYKIREDGVQVSFPKRDESMLLDWLLKTIKHFGKEGLEIAKKVAYDQGKERILTSTPHIQELTEKQKHDILEQHATLIGYVIDENPHTIEKDSNNVNFNVYNCPFHQYIHSDDYICQIHESFLKGQIDVLFPDNEFTQLKSMLGNCNECQYKIK